MAFVEANFTRITLIQLSNQDIYNDITSIRPEEECVKLAKAFLGAETKLVGVAVYPK